MEITWETDNETGQEVMVVSFSDRGTYPTDEEWRSYIEARRAAIHTAREQKQLALLTTSKLQELCNQSEALWATLPATQVASSDLRYFRYGIKGDNAHNFLATKSVELGQLSPEQRLTLDTICQIYKIMEVLIQQETLAEQLAILSAEHSMNTMILDELQEALNACS